MILVDINIFMDVLMARQGVQSSAKVIDLVSNRKIDGKISALTVPILWFHVERVIGSRKAKIIVKDIIQRFEVIPLDETILKQSFIY